MLIGPPRRNAVDILESEYPPDPGRPVALRTYSVSGMEFGCMTARPSSQQPAVAAKIHIFEKFFDLRKSLLGLLTVLVLWGYINIMFELSVILEHNFQPQHRSEFWKNLLEWKYENIYSYLQTVAAIFIYPIFTYPIFTYRNYILPIFIYPIFLYPIFTYRSYILPILR
jgi:hypothetical protein